MPFKLKDIWALRVRPQMENRIRELALFDLGIDSKLRGCDLVRLKVRDICHGEQVATRAIVMQQKIQRPVQLELTPPTRDAVQKWMREANLRSEDFLFPSRIHDSRILVHASRTKNLRAVQLLLGHTKLDYLPRQTMSRAIGTARCGAVPGLLRWT